MKTVAEFRRAVKARFPHVKVKVSSVSFADLARGGASCLEVSGERGWIEVADINAMAQEAGILPDKRVRF